MLNVLYDGFPDDYNGYLIRTDYRIGLQILQCLDDKDFTENEKYAQVVYLLFGNGAPNDWNEAFEGVRWFINGGRTDVVNEEIIEPILDFMVDNRRIRTAFLRYYGIDLSKEYMHYFDFMDRLSDIGECALANVMQIRGRDENDKNLDSKTRERLRRLKKEFGLHRESKFTDDQQEQLDAFMEMIKADRK